MKASHYKPEFFGLVFCLILGFLSGYFANDVSSLWYYSTTKPSFNPPQEVFAPVWSVLYAMIGAAGGKIWRIRNEEGFLWGLFLLQLLVNILWTPLFFMMHRIDYALVDISILWGLLALILIKLWHRKEIFFWLLPYFSWVSFAACLNYSFYMLNLY
jgi:translocator protein